MKKILLAGPGTGKTRKVKEEFLTGVEDFEKVLILSFTNATVNDLRSKFSKAGIAVDERNCMTLHSYALKLNHKREMHILSNNEENIIKGYAKSLSVDFTWFCELLDCITYDQMVLNIVDFAKLNPVYLQEKIGQIELLVVDEFQDFNDFEQSLIHLIAGYAKDTLILGDDDQAIYGFKDAEPDGIIALHKDTSIEKIAHENICYRCPDCVVEKCANLIALNKNRVSKDWNVSGKEGTIDFRQIATIPETVQWVADEIVNIKTKIPNASILVLTPVKFAVEGLGAELEARGIPYEDFFKDTLDPVWEVMIWTLRLVYGDKKLLNLLLLSKASKMEPYPWSKFKKILNKHIASGFTFKSVFPDVQSFINPDTLALLTKPPKFEEILKTEPWSQLAPVFEEVEGNDANEKLERVMKFLDPPMTTDKTNVNIMTIHKSKGLEAEHVFLLGMVDGILPREAVSLEGMEKDRRLLFVGMSRAEVALHMVATVRWNATDVHRLGTSKFTPVHRGRHYWNGRTSPFIKELQL